LSLVNNVSTIYTLYMWNVIQNDLRQIGQPYTRYMTYNSLPRRAAMTRHTDCHAGQQQQPGLVQRV